jgi:uncharacterized protein (DUF427 family)
VLDTTRGKLLYANGGRPRFYAPLEDFRENAPLADTDRLDGHATLERADEWWAEDEQVRALRDPFHRIDVLPSSRRVQVLAGDEVLVDSGRAVLLFETGLKPVAYVPRADVRAPVEALDKRTYCPYKGEASYWTVGGIEAAAWSYEYPRPESSGIEGRLAFDASKVDVRLG